MKNSYYNPNLSSHQNIDDIYNLKYNSQQVNYDVNNLIDTNYYQTKETKITAETYVYVRKTN